MGLAAATTGAAWGAAGVWGVVAGRGVGRVADPAIVVGVGLAAAATVPATAGSRASGGA